MGRSNMERAGRDDSLRAQLAVVADGNQRANDGDEALRLGGLRGLVDQHGAEAEAEAKAMEARVARGHSSIPQG